MIPPTEECRDVAVINGKEWICVREVHDGDPPSDEWWHQGDVPNRDRHHYVRRYPGTNH